MNELNNQKSDDNLPKRGKPIIEPIREIMQRRQKFLDSLNKKDRELYLLLESMPI